MISLLIGQALAAGPVTLNYEAALQQALDRNPTLVGSNHDVSAASGALLAAKGTFDPMLRSGTTKTQTTSESIREFGEVLSDFESLSWNVGVDQVMATGTTFSVDWSQVQTRFRYEIRDTGFVVEQEDPLFQTRMVASISQSLLDGFRMSSNLAGVRQASASLSIAQAEQAATRQQILADVATAYWNLRTTQRLGVASMYAEQAAKEEQRMVHLKVEQGTLAPVEKARVDAAAVQAESARIDAEHNAMQAADALLLLIGEAPGQRVKLTSEPADVQPLNLDADALVKVALESNPSLIAARARSSAAELWALDARHRRLPKLDANATYGLVGYEPSASKSNSELLGGELPDWSVGATLSIPLLNRADRGAYMERSAQAARARIDHKSLEYSINQQVRTQVRTLTAAHTQVRLARANLALAEQTLAAERALQEAGRAVQKDVLESMSAANDAQVAVERALSDYQLALIELERLKGTL